MRETRLPSMLVLATFVKSSTPSRSFAAAVATVTALSF